MICCATGCGINDVAIQRRLLAEPDIDFEKALKIAQSMEMADQDAQQLRGQTAEAVRQREAVYLTESRQAPSHKGRAWENKPTTNLPTHNCNRCGGRHRGVCRHINTVCHACGKKGHLARVCLTKKKAQRQRSPPPPNTNSVSSDEPAREAEEGVYMMFPLRKETFDQSTSTIIHSRWRWTLAPHSLVISEATFREVWGQNAPPLEPARIKLTTYTGEYIPIQGALDVEVEHNGVSERVQLIVTKGKGPSLLGRNWLERLRIDWKGVYMLQARESLGSILDRHLQRRTGNYHVRQSQSMHRPPSRTAISPSPTSCIPNATQS